MIPTSSPEALSAVNAGDVTWSLAKYVGPHHVVVDSSDRVYGHMTLRTGLRRVSPSVHRCVHHPQGARHRYHQQERVCVRWQQQHTL